MRLARLAWLFFKVGSLNELQYRTNFFIQLLQSAVSVGVALVVLKLVYSHTTELNGWGESELLVVLGIQLLLGGVIRTMFMSTLGMVTFWTTRVSALFELLIALELLLSGRLVPLPLMPDWAEDIANVLPFKWSFYFPIETLVGDMSNRELLEGLGMQLLWFVALTGLFLFVWRFAVRRYSAVGN